MKSKKTLVLFLILCFLTILIVVGSVLFSVKTVVGYCYNADDSALNVQVVDSAQTKLKKGTNIFLVREKDIIEEVESQIPNIKVINVERRFPSDVYINYIKIYEYFVVKSGPDYLYVSNESKILRKTSSQDKDARIKLLFAGKPDSTTEGHYLFNESSPYYAISNSLMASLSRVEKYDNLIEMFDFIDISYVDKNELFIKTKTGAYIEIQHPETNILGKVQLAMSILNKKDFDYKSKGTITVYDSNKKIAGVWADKDKYAEFTAQV